MPKAIPASDKKTQDWLAEKSSKTGRFIKSIKGAYYNAKPKRLRFFGALHGVTRTALASSAPGLGWYYGNITGKLAFIAGAGLFAVNMVASFLDSMSREKTTAAQDVQTDMVIRIGDFLATHQAKTTGPAHARESAIRACLGIMEGFARQTTKQPKGRVSVSLLVYRGSGTSRMFIRARNPGNERPVGREIDADKLLGHRVCSAGASPRVVDDVRELGKTMTESPSQSQMVYRSIYFIPLDVQNGSNTGIRGFISIDCDQPYAFYGNRKREIIVNCEPILSHIKDLL